MEQSRPYEVISSQRHQIGRITVVKDIIRLEDGEHPYTYVEMADSVCVLPVFEGKVIAIDQYRHTLNRWVLELPCGGLEGREDPVLAARRELEEETGFHAGELAKLGCYYTNQGISTTRCTVFFTACRGRGKSHPESTELIRVREIPIAEFDAMAADGRFSFLVGLAAWQQAVRRGMVRWAGT